MVLTFLSLSLFGLIVFIILIPQQQQFSFSDTASSSSSLSTNITNTASLSQPNGNATSQTPWLGINGVDITPELAKILELKEPKRSSSS